MSETEELQKRRTQTPLFWWDLLIRSRVMAIMRKVPGGGWR